MPARGAGVAAASCDASETPPWIVSAPDLDGPLAIAPTASDSTAPLGVATYNIHSGLGGDSWPIGRSQATIETNLRGIARHLATAGSDGAPPDVVALNEVDFGSRRSAWIDEASFLADELTRLTGERYEQIRAETWHRTTFGREVRFGNALLTRDHVLESQRCLLDGVTRCTFAAEGSASLPALASDHWLDRLLGETRGVLRITIEHDGRPLDVLVTHLDALSQNEREAQAAHLVTRFVARDRPTVLLGDLNAVPTVLTGGRSFFGDDRTHDILTSGELIDARFLSASLSDRRDLAPWATFPSSAPVWPLDAILATPELSPRDVRTIGGHESDHLGMAATLDWSDDAQRARLVERHALIRLRQRERVERCDLVPRAAATLAATARWLTESSGLSAIAISANQTRTARIP